MTFNFTKTVRHKLSQCQQNMKTLNCIWKQFFGNLLLKEEQLYKKDHCICGISTKNYATRKIFKPVVSIEPDLHGVKVGCCEMTQKASFGWVSQKLCISKSFQDISPKFCSFPFQIYIYIKLGLRNYPILRWSGGKIFLYWLSWAGMTRYKLLRDNSMDSNGSKTKLFCCRF